MATFITNASDHAAFEGSLEKRVDITPAGVLWVMTNEGGTGKFFFSTDNGTTWRYESASDLFLSDQSKQYSNYPSFFIDKDGFAHVSSSRYNYSPQQIVYSRGVPRTGGGWSWSQISVTPQIGGINVDSDIVSFRHGAGYVTWIAYSANNHAKAAQFFVSQNGALSVGAAVHGPPDESSSGTVTMEFDHTGDGKTPSATPHIYITAGNNGSVHELAGFKATYSNGAWSWPASKQHVTIEGTGDKTTGTTNLADTTLVTVYDGDNRLNIAWEHERGIRFAEWTTTGTTVTRRDPPALPVAATGTVLGASLAHDPVTDDIYLITYTSTGESGFFLTRLVRATNTWDAWAKIADRQASYDDGKVHFVRHAPRDIIDMVYATLGAGNTTPFKLYYVPAAQLVRTPAAPALGDPANGQRMDAASGASFNWTHAKTGPSDQQQAWALRLWNGTAFSYWNAGSGAFQSTEIFNAGAASSLSVPPGLIANGLAYLWTVRTRATSNQNSAYAAERSFIATAKPIVDVTSPVGLVFAESNPLITFTYTGADAMRDFEARVFKDVPGLNPDIAVADWVSGIITSSSGRSVRVGVSLLDAQGYVSYVRATSVTNLTSDWSSEAFSLSLEPPSGPLVGITPEPSYENDVLSNVLRIQARSNQMSSQQAIGATGWEDNGNADITYAADPFTETLADGTRRVERGLIMTARAAGETSVRTVIGDPPEAPIGQPALTGPLDFPVEGGRNYTALAYLQSETVIRAAYVMVRWFDNDEGLELAGYPAAYGVGSNITGAQISSATGAQVNIASTGYSEAFVTATAPLNARRAQVVVAVGGAALGERIFTSRMSFHPGDDQRWQPGGYADTQTVRIERSSDGGTTWETVIARAGVDYRQMATAVDRDMPLGARITYRAFTDVQSPSGSILTSGASPMAVVTIDTETWVLRDPTESGSEVNALVVRHDQGDKTAATVHRPLDREFPVVDTENVQSSEGSIEIYVPAALVLRTVALLRRPRPILMQSPAGNKWLVSFLSRDYETQGIGSRMITADYVQVG